MKKLKVLTIVGTRPEIIRLSRVMARLDKYCEHTIAHTGQNYDYELNEIFFNDLDLRKPDYFMEAANQEASQTTGKIIIEADKIISKIKPDALLILGDTNSCLSAIAAKKRKIPIFHMEAGNRCFDQRVPEETNRKIIDHIADINLPYSDIARQYLIMEGIKPDTIIKTGSPMNEVISYYREGIESSNIVKKEKLTKYNYFLVSAHREENVDSKINLKKLADILNHLSSTYKLPIVMSTHPRTRDRLNKSKIDLDSHVRLLKPLGFKDYLNLQINAKATLSDSGTITEESSILNFPALNIREAHERPEGMEEGSVMLVGLDQNRLMQSLNIVIGQSRGTSERLLQKVSDYDSPNVSEKVVRIIHSYTDYIQRTVWKKY